MTFKYFSLTPQQCEVCESRINLLRCGGCQVAHYCNDDHQRLHRKSHKDACVTIKKARKRFSREETLLRSHPDDGFGGGNISEEHFDYMSRRYELVDSMIEKLPRHQVTVDTALDHIMDMLRLDRIDNLNLRYMAPALMLRLRRDQDAYDFVKWWATSDNYNADYNWGDLELPYLDTKNADVLEQPKWWTRTPPDPSLASAVTLIKLRLLFTLRDLQNAERALQASTILPREIVDQVREELMADSALAGRRALAFADTTTLAAMIKRVKIQIRVLYSVVKYSNADFWLMLLAITNRVQLRDPKIPGFCSLESRKETELTAWHNHRAWEETPGALDELHAIWSCQNSQL